MGKSNVWLVQECEGADYLCCILDFLLSEYIRIFGENCMFNEQCIIYNEPLASCPMLVTNTHPLRIRLSQKSLNYWAQTIFQLSHELCHYAIRQSKDSPDYTLSWFEEIICEAMSLYALVYSERNWRKCSLSEVNPSFDEAIKRYFIEEYFQEATKELARCKTVESLKVYEESKMAQNIRSSHINERNRIFNSMMKNPQEISCIVHYQDYIDHVHMITLDFEKWYIDHPCNLVLQMMETQPIRYIRK